MGDITADNLRQAGVVGAGGAGFPTHVKLSGRADAVVLNAAECEPLLHKDKELLRCRGRDVLVGLTAAMKLTGASRAIIGIKEKYVDVIDALGPMLEADMSIHRLADVYPAGDEMVLVYNTLGRVVPPGGIPLAVGAVVMNVETAINVAAAANEPVTEKYVSVGGAVANPVTLRVPVGVSLADCVEAAGGATVDDPNYVVGGTMMGTLQDDRGALVDKTTGGLIVLGSDHVVVRRKRGDWKTISSIGRSACDQCCFCTELCPRYLLGHPIEPHKAMRSLGFNMIGEANVRGTSFCCECNLCSMYSCPESLDPKGVCAENRSRIAGSGQKWTTAPFDQTRADRHMKNRQAPMRRLMRRLDLLKFNNVGPLVDAPVETSRVGIALKQHVGAPCEPTVAVGQVVSRGQLVGQVPISDGRPALGAAVHASIDGTVTAVRDGIIWIERQ